MTTLNDAPGAFENRTALVTGGSRGIGRATCIALARQGARVAINYISNESAARETLALVEQAGGTGALFSADVANENAVNNLVTRVESELGPVDHLVACAGVSCVEPHQQMRYENFQRVMKVNVDGVYLSVMAVKDAMIARGSGSIVCIASIAGLASRPQMIAYSVSKAAVVAFVRSTAGAFGPQVRINAVAPGLIETDMITDMSPEMRTAMIEDAALKRLGRPEDIAQASLYLLSDRAGFITGQTWVVDGGRVMLP